MIREVDPAEIRQRMKDRESFVVNIVAAWCPDCTERQQPHFSGFTEKMEAAATQVYQCCVQTEKLVFDSEEHKSLTDNFGGHGYPRTVLIKEGRPLTSRVEVMDPLALGMLADEFIAAL